MVRHHKSDEGLHYKDEESGKNNMVKIEVQDELQLAWYGEHHIEHQKLHPNQANS